MNAYLALGFVSLKELLKVFTESAIAWKWVLVRPKMESSVVINVPKKLVINI
jgi:hypothetical protein